MLMLKTLSDMIVVYNLFRVNYSSIQVGWFLLLFYFYGFMNIKTSLGELQNLVDNKKMYLVFLSWKNK